MTTTGPTTPDGGGRIASLRTVNNLTIQTWAIAVFDPNDDHHQIDWGPTQYAVMAGAGNVSVRVANFTDAADADTYVTTDPDGHLS